MEVRAAMLEYLLGRSGREVLLKGDGDVIIKRIRPYRKGSREAGTFYLADGVSPIPEPPSNAEFVIVQFDGDMADAYDTLRSLDAWDAALKDALIEGASLDDFISLGHDLLGCPLAYFDRNLIVLASSDDFWESGPMGDGDSAGVLHVEGQMPSSRAANLIEDIDYLHAADIHDGFYYTSSHGRVYYGMNTFDNGKYLARLVVALPEGAQKLHRGQEQLIGRFHALLDDLHLRFGGNVGIVSSQNDALHVLARRALLGDGAASVARDEACALLDSFNWSYDDDFVVARLVFFEGLHWNTVSLYLCGLLERSIAGSCAFPVEQEIVWLANLNRSARADESRKATMQRFTESLVSVLRTYACKAGISDVFAGFSGTCSAFKEACFALEIGQSRDPHYWYFVFGDYKLDYLLSKCGEDLEPRQVCHPALEALLVHDAAHETDYARTLVCFLRNSQNTTYAANELFIHRTSFMRRMARIAELTHVDLTDADQVLHLLLSAKLLGM